MKLRGCQPLGRGLSNTQAFQGCSHYPHAEPWQGCRHSNFMWSPEKESVPQSVNVYSSRSTNAGWWPPILFCLFSIHSPSLVTMLAFSLSGTHSYSWLQVRRKPQAPWSIRAFYGPEHSDWPLGSHMIHIRPTRGRPGILGRVTRREMLLFHGD